MSKAALGIALGISAVDALLSAFTALLLLAVIILSPAEGGRGNERAQDMQVLMIEKIASGRPTMPVRLLLEIISDQQSQVVTILPKDAGLVEVSEHDARSLVRDGGTIAWFDCRTQQTTCPSMLMVTRPRGEWKIRVSIATTDDLLRDGVPESIGLRIHRAGAASPDNVVLETLKINESLKLCPRWDQTNASAKC